MKPSKTLFVSWFDFDEIWLKVTQKWVKPNERVECVKSTVCFQAKLRPFEKLRQKYQNLISKARAIKASRALKRLDFSFVYHKLLSKNEHILTTLLFCCWIIASEEKDETQNGSKSSQMFCVWIIYFVSRSYLVQVSKPAKKHHNLPRSSFFLWFSFGYPISIRNMIFYLILSIWDEETFSEPVKNVTHK